MSSHKKLKAKTSTGLTVDFEQYVNQCLKVAVDKAAEEAITFLCDYIQTNWYSKYDPKSYKRTYDFLASATKTEASINQNGEVTALLFFDEEKLLPEPRERGLNAHMNFKKQPFTGELIGLIENGGSFYGRGKTEPLGSMQATIVMLRKKFPSMVRKNLIDMGLKVRFAKTK